VKYRGYRVDVVLALALLTLVAFVGGQAFYGRMFIERPLLEQLQSVPGVTEVTVEKYVGSYDITLNLANESNLPTVYRQVTELTKRTLGSDSFELRVTDNRTPKLETLYRQMQIYIEEAVAQGNFSTAAEKLNEVASRFGVRERFYVDEEFVYLELYQDEAYLYAVRRRVLPRKEAGTII
jgi:hypothetical protein